MAVRDPGTVADYQSRRAILMFLTREVRTAKKERKSENGNTIIYMVGKEERERRGWKTRTCGGDGRKVVENKVIIFFSGRKGHQLDEDQGDRLL